jgi:hypothetical protein
VKVSRTCFWRGIFNFGLRGSVFECLSSPQTERWVFERWRFLDDVTHLNSVEISLDVVLGLFSRFTWASNYSWWKSISDHDVNFHCCGSNCSANGIPAIHSLQHHGKSKQVSSGHEHSRFFRAISSSGRRQHSSEWEMERNWRDEFKCRSYGLAHQHPEDFYLCRASF